MKLLETVESAAFLAVILCVSTEPKVPPCSSDPLYQTLPSGDYYRTREGSTIWHQCSFPNPRTQWKSCGRQGPSWLCDPDALLSSQDAVEVEKALNSSISGSLCHCPNKQCAENNGHVILIALARTIAITNLAGIVCNHQVVRGVCLDKFPKLNPLARRATKQEKQTALAEFTEAYYKNIKPGACGNGLVFLFVQDLNWYWVYAGHITKDVLKERFLEVPKEISAHLTEGDLRLGLLKLLEGYDKVLQHKPKWPLVLGLTLVGIIGAIIVFTCIVIVVFIIYERCQGKNWYEVCMSLSEGFEAVLLCKKPAKKLRPNKTKGQEENVPIKGSIEA